MRGIRAPHFFGAGAVRIPLRRSLSRYSGPPAGIIIPGEPGVMLRLLPRRVLD
jgi:hypothetical protein